jgi:hypothetical protein
VDYNATSRRPQWVDLPQQVRATIAELGGALVRRAHPSVTSGFSGGFAALLDLADGRSVFAKAGSAGNPRLIESYAQEARVLAALPDGLPVAALVGAHHLVDDDGLPWQVVITEAVDGRMPLDWTIADLDAVHESCLVMAELLTPPPAGLAELLAPLRDQMGGTPITQTFARIMRGEQAVTRGQPAWLGERLDDLNALVGDPGLVEAALSGDTGCHLDLRADNVLITTAPDGARPTPGAVVVDWNWLSVGPAWVDLVSVLPIAAAGQAGAATADALLRTSPLTRDVDPEHPDVWAALLVAYFLAQADEPVWPGGLPVIRDHQRWYARCFLDWLGARRGWS